MPYVIPPAHAGVQSKWEQKCVSTHEAVDEGNIGGVQKDMKIWNEFIKKMGQQGSLT